MVRTPCAPKILIVDDDLVVTSFIEMLLQRAHFEVLVANSPEQAKELFANESDRINVLITDMVMPRQSGPELAQELLSRRPNLNVIFISGYCEKPPTVAAPVVQFIRKPFSSKELLNCVRALSVGPDLK